MSGDILDQSQVFIAAQRDKGYRLTDRVLRDKWAGGEYAAQHGRGYVTCQRVGGESVLEARQMTFGVGDQRIRQHGNVSAGKQHTRTALEMTKHSR